MTRVPPLTRALRHPDLLACAAVTMATAALVALAPEWRSPIRVLLGFVVVMFAPGYVLQVSMFPRHGDAKGLERLALTLGLSIVAIPLVGLSMNFTPWGIRMVPVSLALAALVCSGGIVAAIRRAGVPLGERFVMAPGRPGFGASLGMSAVVLAAVSGVIGTTLWLRPTVDVTEFYLLDGNRLLRDFPRSLSPAEPFELTVGIANREDEAGDYLLRFPFGDDAPVRVGRLDPGAVWERTVTLTAPNDEGCARLPIHLEKAGEPSPYRRVELVVPVGSTGATGLEGRGDCP